MQFLTTRKYFLLRFSKSLRGSYDGYLPFLPLPTSSNCRTCLSPPSAPDSMRTLFNWPQQPWTLGHGKSSV